jgi:hypothetical protein
MVVVVMDMILVLVVIVLDLVRKADIMVEMNHLIILMIEVTLIIMFHQADHHMFQVIQVFQSHKYHLFSKKLIISQVFHLSKDLS